MNGAKFDRAILRIFAILLVLGGLVHWLIIFGVMTERTPLLIEAYFHSLAILSPAAGVGLWLRSTPGIQLATFIFITQIPAHLYMIYLDSYQGWESGYSVPMRLLDIAMVVIGLLYFRIRRRFA